MKSLYPSFAPPEKWRNQEESDWLKSEKWQLIRKSALERGRNTCVYCGYYSEKYQIIDHIDGDPYNHRWNNLQVICQMCNLVKHAGQGVILQEIVDLYYESRYIQNEIIRLTRELRDQGKKDNEIIRFLGLKNKVEFKMNQNYLKKLYAFVSSRKSQDGMYSRWYEYHKKHNQKIVVHNNDKAKQKKLSEFSG